MIFRGVKKYPEMIKSVQPTFHKYGADLTWSAHTDTYRPTIDGHGIDFEIHAFKYNFKGTILLNHQTDSAVENEIKGALSTGVLDAGAYFRAAEELQPQIDWLIKVIGKKPSYLSYANGVRNHDDFVLKNSLVSRLSSDKSVDYDFDVRLGHPNSSIFNYNVRDTDMTSALSNAKINLQKAIDAKGWFNDFSHWHWANFYGDKDQWDQFMKGQKSLLNNTHYVSLGASEAIEYMWLRKQFKRGGLYEDNGELVLLCETINDERIPYEAIDTTLSVKVDTTDTILEGKDITSNTQILKTGTNQYIVQIPYKNMSGFSTVRLRSSSNQNYITTNLPKVLKEEINQNTVRIVSDIKTKKVMFTTNKSEELYTAEVSYRHNDYRYEHTFDVTGYSDKDIYIGLLSEAGQSILTKLGGG